MPPTPHLMPALIRMKTWLERHTKTDLSYLFSGGFWLTLDEAAGAFCLFLLAIAFAHFVPKEDYGTYRFLIAALWTLTAFTMTGLPTAISRAVARGYEGTYRAAFPYSVLWSLPLSAIAIITAGYYFLHNNLIITYGFLIIALLGPFLQVGYLWGAFLIGTKRFHALAIGGFAFAALPALAIYASMLLDPTPLVLLAAYLLGTILCGLSLAAYIIFHYRPNTAIDSGYKHLGGHFSAMNLLSTVAQQVDKLVVFHFLGGVDLAVYSFATALPEQVKGVFGSVSTLALPKFVARPFAEIRANFWYRLLLFTAMLCVGAIAYMIIAPFIFKLFFPAYSEAIWYSQLYALSLIPIGSALSVTLLQAHTAKRELYILNTLGPILQIGALIILTSWYGLIGAIVARISARVISFILSCTLVEAHWYRVRSTE